MLDPHASHEDDENDEKLDTFPSQHIIRGSAELAEIERRVRERRIPLSWGKSALSSLGRTESGRVSRCQVSRPGRPHEWERRRGRGCRSCAGVGVAAGGGQ